MFLACEAAIRRGELVRRPSERDKEFAFQNWVAARLVEAGVGYESSGRNTYPDFRLTEIAEGYEVKALTTPGRWESYDSNSGVPSGRHGGRQIFYVFGRYPKEGGAEYPIVDLVLCHGDFLNAHHDYVHQNKAVRRFGSYGDIMIRDRKMYVPRTPYALATGLADQHTLILPANVEVDERLERVGELVRIEANQLVTSYTFDLTTNELVTTAATNPSAGLRHEFVAYRVAGAHGPRVELIAT